MGDGTSSLTAIGRLLGTGRLKGMAAVFGLHAPISAKEIRAQAAAREFLSPWELVTPFGIEKDQQKAAWHAGRVNDVFLLDSDRVLIASATGGVWLASQGENFPTFSLSLTWPSVNLRCLGQGPRGPRHIYAAGDHGVLFETETQSLRSVCDFLGVRSAKEVASNLGLDPKQSISLREILRSTDAPLQDWKAIPFVDSLGQELPDKPIYRMVCVTDTQPPKLVLATGIGPTRSGVGLYWSDIPGAGQAYRFAQAAGIPPLDCLGVATSPGATVVASPNGNKTQPEQTGIYLGTWIDGDLQMRRAVHVGDINFAVWNAETVLAGCAGTPSVLYAAASSAGDGVRSVRRAFRIRGISTPQLSVKQLAAAAAAPKPPSPPISITKLVDAEAIYAVLHSQDGGRSWSPVGPNQRVSESVQFPRVSNYQSETFCIDVCPVDPTIVALGTRTGPRIGQSTPTEFTWKDHGEKGTPRGAGSPHLHGDLRTLQFDMSDPNGKTLYVCSDGGLAGTKDLANTFFSSLNRSLPNLQFMSYPASPDRAAPGASGASFDTPGLVAGPLQDNGVVFSYRIAGPQGPWQQQVGGDGLLAVFLETDLLLFWTADPPATARVAKWRGTHFDPEVNVQVRTPSGAVPAGSTFSQPFAEPVMAPVFRRAGPDAGLTIGGAVGAAVGGGAQANQLMLAVASDPNSNYRDIWGLFADDDGGNPSWDFLATLPDPNDQVTAIGSRDGSTVLVGTQVGNIFSVDPRSGMVGKLPFAPDTPPPTGNVYQFAFGNTWSVARYQNALARLDIDGGAWSILTTNGLPINEGFLYFMATDTVRTPNILYVATDYGVHTSWDAGANWLPVSQGLPVRAHPSTLRFIREPNGARKLYLFTFGWSAFRTELV